MTGLHLAVETLRHRAFRSRPRPELAPFAHAVPGLWAEVALREVIPLHRRGSALTGAGIAPLDAHRFDPGAERHHPGRDRRLIALPAMERDLGFGLSGVVNAYLLPLAALLLFGGLGRPSPPSSAPAGGGDFGAPGPASSRFGLALNPEGAGPGARAA